MDSHEFQISLIIAMVVGMFTYACEQHNHDVKIQQQLQDTVIVVQDTTLIR